MPCRKLCKTTIQKSLQRLGQSAKPRLAKPSSSQKLAVTQSLPAPSPAPVFNAPYVYIPAIRVPQPDGSILIKPGKPQILPEMIGTRDAAKLLGMSPRWVAAECDLGRFATARKPGVSQHSRWQVARVEVLERLKQVPD
jgi:hypothetical protein